MESVNEAHSNRHNGIKIVIAIFMTLVVAISTYLWLCYTNNKFISKYRRLYIETATSTMTHGWLATAILPYDVVNPVLEDANRDMNSNLIETSSIVLPYSKTSYEILYASHSELMIKSELSSAKAEFIRNFPEIDSNTLPDDLDYSNLDIKDISDLGILTVQGDPVWAINTKEKIVIAEISGKDYYGKMVIIKDPSRVGIVKTKFNNSGQSACDMMNDSGGILAINGGGFSDAGGNSNGSTPIGIVISNNEVISSNKAGGGYQVAALDKLNNFVVGQSLDINNLRDAVEFFPILVINGEKFVKGTHGMGVQPRTVVGQTKDKTMLFLVIDGRQLGYSIGINVEQAGEIMVKYHAWTAMNMDGGASSELAYEGVTINKPCSAYPNGRRVATAWVVYPLNKDIVEGY